LDIPNLTEVFLLALCIYREARGEPDEAKFAVGCVVRNRVQHPGWWGHDYFTVITKPWQFSSFNKGEVNSIVFGSPGDVAWQSCFEIAWRILFGGPDTTNGATYYYDKSLDKNPPKWAAESVHTADIGSFHFFVAKS
jgi:N-acetylmuramoyl-L-alanine amidase